MLQECSRNKFHHFYTRFCLQLCKNYEKRRFQHSQIEAFGVGLNVKESSLLAKGDIPLKVKQLVLLS